MNEKTMHQIEAMKTQSYGVEVEFNNVTRKKAAETVAKYFGTTAYFADGQYGYMTWACKDTQGRVWKIQRDSSIKGPDDERCDYPARKFIQGETQKTLMTMKNYHNLLE